MGFSKKIKEDTFVKSARHCCVCHRRTGFNIEVHHIVPQQQGGKDTIDNAIALCFDCHADAGHYFANHPKGARLSPEELRKHRDAWFEIVERNHISQAPIDAFELSVDNREFGGRFQPIFIREITTLLDRDLYLKTWSLIGKNLDDVINKIKDENNALHPFYQSPSINKIQTYDDLIDYFNGDFPEKNYLIKEDENENIDCQPLEHVMPTLPFCREEVLQNHSNCVIKLRFTNFSTQTLDNYKLYLTFENVINVDTVNKKTVWHDLHNYDYTIKFLEWNKAEFLPKKDILLQNDSVVLDMLCFRTHHKTKNINIRWQMLARGIQHEGNLSIEIKPKFKIEKDTRFEVKTEKPRIRHLPYIIPQKS